MRNLSEGTVRWIVAAAVGVCVGAIGMWAQNSALVGVNYDDGIYALLAKALAEGDGYRLTSTPVELPAIKYPPVYPVSLVPFWALTAGRETALTAMKLANGVYIGIAAALCLMLLADRRILPLYLAAPVTLLGFVSGSMMLVTAGLLSEPLYLLLLFSALWAADATPSHATSRRWAMIGTFAGLVMLTRMVGVAAVAAVLVGAWRRGGRRSALIAAAGSSVLIVPWLLFTAVNAGRVPEALVPRYGSYTQLYLSNLAGSPGAAFQILSTNVGAILQTLGGKLVPQAGGVIESLLGAALLGAALLGARRISSTAPATAVYPWFYLGLIAVWSFPPFRFLFILFPLLLALSVASVAPFFGRVAEAMRRGDGRAGGPARSAGMLALLAAVLAVNLGYVEARAVVRRVWDGAEFDKSASGIEVIEWVLNHTDSTAVIAYEFDPMIALYTGRRTVPNNYEPVHLWYRREPPPVEPLARLLKTTGVDFLAVRRNVPLAAAPVDALIERYPEALRLTFVTGRGAFIFATNLAALGGDLNPPHDEAAKTTENRQEER